MTTALEKYLAIAVGVVVALFGALLWWHMHNAGERKAGAAECIQAHTETASQAVATNTSIETDQIDLIKQKVADYDAKLSKANADNADLASRLRAVTIRSGTVSHPGGVACKVPANFGSSGSQSQVESGSSASTTGIDPIAADFTAALNAADKAQLQAEGCAALYNDWRDRIIEFNQGIKKPPYGGGS